MKKVAFIVYSILMFSQFANCQLSDTIIALKEVITTGARFDSYSIGARIHRIDTALTQLCQTENIGELLSRYSLVSVKSYGPSGLSSISMRGGSSRHTAVIWNGFNLKSPMSGSLNFSSLPAGFVDQITIQSGGSATMYGSGASTGVIFLGSNLYSGSRDLNVNLNLEMASFNTYAGSLIITHKAPKLSSRLKLGYIESDNNFPYTSQTFGKPILKLAHASFSRYAVSQQNTLITGKRSKLESDIWFTSLFKNIPSLLSDEDAGTAKQTDENFKSAITFSYYKKRFTLKIRSGFFFDEVFYVDTVPQLIESNNKSYSLLNEVESKIIVAKNHVFNIGINQSYDHASSSGYVTDTGQVRYSLYGRYNIFMYDKKVQVSFEARQEIIKQTDIPMVFSFGSQYKMATNTFIKANISKHYSLPVLDDLFWGEDAFAVGNPNLKPEYGWNYEAGIKNILLRNGITFENELTIFQNRIKDLIIWQPGLDNGKYSPKNINNSISTGIEFSGSFSKQLTSEKQINLFYCFAYINAKGSTEDSNDDWSQRLYVPMIKSNMSIQFLANNWQLTYNQFFESKRFYDDKNALDAYTLADINLRYKLPLQKPEIQTYFKVKNLFNIEYQIHNGYAQPLRNYTLGLNMKF